MGPEVALLDCRSNDDGPRLVEMGCARIAIGAPGGRVRAAADVRRGIGDVGARGGHGRSRYTMGWTGIAIDVWFIWSKVGILLEGCLSAASILIVFGAHIGASSRHVG